MSLVCNICGYPAKITYKEQDPETGKTHYITDTVQCLGHDHLHPALWNRHPGHSKYRQFYNQLKTKLGQSVRKDID